MTIGHYRITIGHIRSPFSWFPALNECLQVDGGQQQVPEHDGAGQQGHQPRGQSCGGQVLTIDTCM